MNTIWKSDKLKINLGKLKRNLDKLKINFFRTPVDYMLGYGTITRTNCKIIGNKMNGIYIIMF